ncbi:type VII toxin-antitoxin system HepT family RNase toxin [Ectothiorhodospira mobilis]|uniref:Uncharacterized conserved protein YutE, UPF0331/DUF86 family n=1 Tax=Ectothiorhodospira mobilis TaxID=195064 RepID=A0A1I4RPW1_ECTMO|nr:HepT-like ribonuclease domain-containing protein [Ectothiorhodospira mobilis]MCG5534916.1 DUF86 domain-containing protein [Ectothiorhodospira mobilis]SFM54322.1 Uncharacterized conserved protein YutE, UPF0331/DUF86 family [Ectothiorhodospira mobilis]
MTPDRVEIIQRKLRMLRQFLTDLDSYSTLDTQGRRREHYAVERLLQLLCESSADLGLQLLRLEGHPLAASYREVFAVLRDRLGLPEELASALMDACAMRNLLTHLYDSIDLDRVIGTIEPALEVYGRFERWVRSRVA